MPPNSGVAWTSVGDPSTPPSESVATRTAALSQAALLHGARLARVAPNRVAGALYRFNTMPLTDQLARWDDSPEGSVAVAVDGSHEFRPSEGWAVFVPRSRATPTTYKLYVSPQPDDLGVTLTALVDVVGRRPATTFKVGRGRAGCARPDKIVVYFPTFGEMSVFASQLADALAVRAHGVPFTSQLDDSAVLSWGTDRAVASLSTEPTSWRGELCRALAGALIGAVDDGLEASIAASRRTATALGVDATTWTYREAVR